MKFYSPYQADHYLLELRELLLMQYILEWLYEKSFLKQIFKSNQLNFTLSIERIGVYDMNISVREIPKALLFLYYITS